MKTLAAFKIFSCSYVLHLTHAACTCVSIFAVSNCNIALCTIGDIVPYEYKISDNKGQVTGHSIFLILKTQKEG